MGDGVAPRTGVATGEAGTKMQPGASSYLARVTATVPRQPLGYTPG